MKPVFTTRIDMIAVSSIVIEPTSTTQTMKATVAFVDSKMGQSVGYTDATEGWSEETRKAVTNLIACIEEDVAAGLADQGGPSIKPEDSTATGGGLFSE